MKIVFWICVLTLIGMIFFHGPLASSTAEISQIPEHTSEFASQIPRIFVRSAHEYPAEENIAFYIQELQNFTTRYSFSNNSSLAAEWLFNTMCSFGLWVEWDYFVYNNVTMKNVIATLNGSSANEVFILSAHYDSINLADSVNSINDADVPAPGANDDASGVAAVLECARILARYNLNATVKFVAFCGEEQGMKGSEHYAEKLASENKTVIGVINLDMVGYSHDSKLQLIYNSDSEWLAERIQEVGLKNSILETERYLDSNAPCDQAPFWHRKYTGILCMGEHYRNVWNLSYPYYHSANDTVDKLNISFAKKVAQLCLASVFEILSNLDLRLGKIEVLSLSLEKTEIYVTVENICSKSTNATVKIYISIPGCTEPIATENITFQPWERKSVYVDFLPVRCARKYLISAIVEDENHSDINTANNIRHKTIFISEEPILASGVFFELCVFFLLLLSLLVWIYFCINQ